MISRLELPRDQIGAWSPRGLIPGKREIVMSYAPTVSSPEAQRQASGRIGVMDLDDGIIRELHITLPGDQIGIPRSDGRYLAWVEVGVFGAKALEWQLFACDLDGSGEVWRVDSGAGDLPWLPVQGPPIAVDGGRLAYSRYAASGADWQSELVTVDLASRSSKVISGDLISTGGHITGVALSGSSITWIRRLFAPAPPQPTTWVYDTDLSTGSPPMKTQLNMNLFTVDRAGALVVATDADGLLVRPGSGTFNRLALSAGPMSPAITKGRVYWIDTGSLRPVSIPLGGGPTLRLDDADALLIFADATTVAWWTRTPDPGGGAPSFFVSWISALP